MLKIHANNEFEFGGKDSNMREQHKAQEQKLTRYLLFHKDSQNLSKYFARALLTYIY
jgi:predicted ATPase